MLWRRLLRRGLVELGPTVLGPTVLGPVAKLAYRLRRRGRTSEEVWTKSIDHEINFWADPDRRENLVWRNDPTQLGELDRPFWDIAAAHPSAELQILDVGAGPITPLAKNLPGKTVTVTAIDALADQYDVILRQIGIEPRVRTEPGHGEALLERFSPRSFDITYAGNALDHTYDPVLVIRNMLELVRDEGSVVLRHYRNEGQKALYRGLHQWNFDLRGGDLVIWNGAGEQNVSRLLSQQAQTQCFLQADEVWAVIAPHAGARG